MHHHRWLAMGTVFEAFLAGDDPEHLEAVAAAAEDEVRRLEAALSARDPAAEVARVNRDAAGRAVTVRDRTGRQIATSPVWPLATGDCPIPIGGLQASTGRVSLRDVAG